MLKFSCLLTVHLHIARMYYSWIIGIFVIDCLIVWGKPHLRMNRELLGLPSNATTIREEISTSFTCESRSYGYYADTENDCQLFHVCLPVQYVDGSQETFKWSFICPQETVFNQETFTCARPEDSVACKDSPLFYMLNDRFGQIDSVNMTNSIDGQEMIDMEMEAL
ncbi:uncharacterized protein LOC111047161 [Nilaparvata lugens]|nr:uncharacterized protein LOC111047161 [Nilaparvata lugens]